MRTIHICDPQLLDLQGHYLNHDAQLIRELRRRQLPVALYARQGCELECEGLKPAPVFSQHIFRETQSDPHVWAIEAFQILNQIFSSDLRRLGPERFAPDDLVYFPNMLQNQIYGVALWLDRMPAERRPAIAVMLRFLNHKMPYLQGRANVALIPLHYRFACQALARLQPRTVFCADTRELAEQYRKITDLPVLELPNPMDISLRPAPAAPAVSDGRPTVVYQGSTSKIRGFDFLPEIVERCARLDPRPRFAIQVQSAAAIKSLNLDGEVERLRRHSSDDVRLIEGALSPDDFWDLLSGSDIVLLPYNPDFYGYGSSGVFTEAASLGKVVVVSPNTVPAREGREHGLGTVVAKEWSAKSMADAVADALRRLPELKAKAVAGAPAYARQNTAAAFWDKLLAAVRPVPQPS